ncbi:MAG TPA: hypothetical protein PLG55_08540, partial [Methanospirillum sp.]|uniref:hypothetical protein n=1 Tax=Methanospirillum sp. TaxID=45200 RepID=UPI002C9E297D
IIRDNRREDEYTPKGSSGSIPTVLQAPLPTGVVPCVDLDFDGICDDPNGTPQPTKAPSTSSVPFSYTEEFTMTTIYTQPEHQSSYYPTPYPTHCP